MFTGFHPKPPSGGKKAGRQRRREREGAIETDRQAQRTQLLLVPGLTKVEAAQVVVNGDYVLYVIGLRPPRGVELFNDSRARSIKHPIYRDKGVPFEKRHALL